MSFSTMALNGFFLVEVLLSTALLSLAILCAYTIWTRWRYSSKRLRPGHPKVVAFFHPYCSSGGGGERVLWKMIQVLGDLAECGMLFQVVVYTVDRSSSAYKQNLLRQVNQKFSIKVSENLPLSFIHLDDFKQYLSPSSRFSLLVESYGTMKLAYRGLRALSPDVFVDTTGCAFTYLVARILFACEHVVAYVHYPTISTDMLQLVFERRRAAYNHSVEISSSRIRTAVKLIYYTLFAALYGAVGSLSTLVLVNSTWTYNHVRSLWRYSAWRNRIHIVFPPCRTADVLSVTSITERQKNVILSIGQFRPEKDHVLQLEAMEVFRRLYPDQPFQLVMIGSCRGDEDAARLDFLRAETRRRHLEDSVEFVVNQPYSVLEEWLQKASIGIHTMWNEHFGIGIVEMMAAGLIVIAHNSGGPKSDIIIPFEGKQTGYLATTPEEYAAAVYKVMTLPMGEQAERRRSAQASSARFSDDLFAESFRKVVIDSNLLTS